MVQGCLISENRIVIPECYRKKILATLHKGHPGINACKTIARNHVYWPNIDQDITDYISNCSSCAVAAKTPNKNILHSWIESQAPMQRIHCDIAGPIKDKYYIVVIDSYSKYPEIFEVTSITSTVVINKLQEFFAHFGLPDTLVTDNGTQFVSVLFTQFCKTNNINHLTTAYYHPSSNGQAERFVDTLKRSLKKQEHDQGSNFDHLQTFLMNYRSTPNKNCPSGKSPAHSFIGREIKTTLHALHPTVEHKQQNRNTKMENAYNEKHSAKSRAFDLNEEVYAKVYNNNYWFWIPAIIIKRIGNVNYLVKLCENSLNKRGIIRSHIDQLQSRSSNSKSNQQSTLLDLLYEDFELPATNTLSAQSSQQPQPSSSSIQPISSTSNSSPNLRKSNRARKRPRYLEDYETGRSSKRGRCSGRD